MKRIIHYCFIIFLFLPSPAPAQTVTIDEFFQQVRSSHPFFQKEELSAEIERREQERLSGGQDWTIRSNPYYLHEESTITGGFFPNQIDQAGLNASLERAYWITGGLFSVTYDYTRTDQEADDILIPVPGGFAAIPGDSGRFHESGFTAAYSQPLIKNMGGVLSRLNYELQDYSISSIEISIKENQENFLLGVGDRFLDWVLLSEQQRILRNRLDLAKEELDRTSRKRKQNLVDEVDVLRAKDAVLNAEQNVLNAEAGWKAKQAELATIGQYTNRNELNPQYDLYSLVSLPPVDEAVEQLKNTSRLLAVFNIRIDQLELKRTGAVEQGKPQLDLDISGGLKSGHAQYEDSHDYDKPQFSAMLNFSYPLGNRTARADILKTKLEKSLVQEDMKNVSLKLESGLRSLMTRIKELEKVLAVNREQIVISREKTVAELKRYNQGRAELTFVIQSRDNEQNVQLIYASNSAAYHKLVLRYHEMMDSLLASGH